MNPLFIPNQDESKLVEYINEFNLTDFALIRLTFTMLDKSIIDASFGLREILFKNKLIDFNELSPGGPKKYCDGIIVSDSIIETKVSFYRPRSKNGDPRFCVYGLKKFVAENQLLYLTIYEERLIIIPLRNQELLSRHIPTIFESIENNSIVILLKEKLHLLSSTQIISVNPLMRYPKDVGLTLENFLGVKVNSLRTPDFLGKIELKSKRELSVKDSLFSKVQDKDISTYKTTKDVILNFGYYDEDNDRRSLYNDITTKPNKQGLFLFPDNENLVLHQKFTDGTNIKNVCAWYYKTLQESLYTKHPTTLWVDAEEIHNENGIHFLYKNFQLTTRPVFSEFISLIEQDIINFDWKGHVKNGKKRDHGPGFRIGKKNRKLLFKKTIDLL